MRRFLLRRTAQGILVFWAAYTFGFLILYALPGDPVEIMLNPGGGTYIPEETIERTRITYGFDQPLIFQYFTRLGGVFVGDLGDSVQLRTPVTEVLLAALPNTAALAAAALLLSAVLGVALALTASITRVPWLRDALLALPPIGTSIPLFWSGIVLIQIVSYQWRLLPALDDGTPAALILPALTLALPTSALIAQVLAESLEEAWRQPFVTTALATGSSRMRAFIAHTLRPAMGPVLALLGIITGSLLAGAVVVETVFSRPGIGRITASAVSRHDIPVVLGVIAFAAAVFVIVTLLVDLLQLRLDPRLRKAVGVHG